jgi:hypothetical protein
MFLILERPKHSQIPGWPPKASQLQVASDLFRYNPRPLARGPLRLGWDTAKVAELVDALDLGSSGETRESSSLSFRTNAGAHALTMKELICRFH